MIAVLSGRNLADCPLCAENNLQCRQGLPKTQNHSQSQGWQANWVQMGPAQVAEQKRALAVLWWRWLVLLQRSPLPPRCLLRWVRWWTFL